MVPTTKHATMYNIVHMEGSLRCSLSDDGCPLQRHKVASYQALSLCEIIAILFKNLITSDLTFFLNIQHAILKASKPTKYRMKQLL